MASLPVVIFQFALSPYRDWQQLAWTGALLITVAVLALSIAEQAAHVADGAFAGLAPSEVAADALAHSLNLLGPLLDILPVWSSCHTMPSP